MSLSALHAGDPLLINIKDIAPDIIVDIPYATTNNFTKTKLYDVPECLLCQPAAERLARVQSSLKKEGLGLKVWDCYRPLSIQKKLWAVVPDPRYVADPKTGSRHNRGASVDLTLVDTNGRELPMPTKFDDFGPRSHRTFMDLPAETMANRKKLQDAMEQEGFIPLPTEWWHFDAPEWNSYALRDEPLGAPSLRVEKLTGAAHFSLPDETTQLLLVLADNWTATTGSLQKFKKVDGAWMKVGNPWPVSLGLKGLAWGQGLHNAQSSGPQKRERDNTAPVGVFPIGQAYGYEATAPSSSRWPYQQADETWRCIDDPTSASYNIVKKTKAGDKQDWTSAEHMKRPDHLYKWAINIEQNFPRVVAGCGSCIFMHVWRRPNSATEGCTAMEEANIVDLLRWLSPEEKPLLIQLPKAEYEKLKQKWKLP